MNTEIQELEIIFKEAKELATNLNGMGVTDNVIRNKINDYFPQLSDMEVENVLNQVINY